MSRFLLVVATLLGKNHAITPRRYYELGLEGEFEERYHLS